VNVSAVMLGPKTISYGSEAPKRAAIAARASATVRSVAWLVANAPPTLAQRSRQ
jgi:hypothetical protein